MPPSPHARPRQVTMAGWVVVLGSVLVVLAVFAQIGSLDSLETRRSVEELLAEPPGDGLGLEVGTVLQVIRVLAMVAGACAAATAILGWQVLQRSRSARLALTVLAVPLFVSGFATGGFTTSLVVAAVAVLWFQPARAWVNGDPVPERYLRPDPEQRRSAPEPAAPSTPGPGTSPEPPTGPTGGPTGPAAYPGFGQASPPQASWPAPAEPWTQQPRTRGPVPHQLRSGLVLTWVTSAVVVVGLVLSMVAIALDPAVVDRELERALAENPAMSGEITVEQLRVAMFVVLGGFAGWALAAGVLAGLAWAGRSWAWVLLCVSAGLAAGLLFLVTVLGGILAAIPLAATAGSLALLLRPEVRSWYAAR